MSKVVVFGDESDVDDLGGSDGRYKEMNGGKSSDEGKSSINQAVSYERPSTRMVSFDPANLPESRNGSARQIIVSRKNSGALLSSQTELAGYSGSPNKEASASPLPSGRRASSQGTGVCYWRQSPSSPTIYRPLHYPLTPLTVITSDTSYFSLTTRSWCGCWCWCWCCWSNCSWGTFTSSEIRHGTENGVWNASGQRRAGGRNDLWWWVNKRLLWLYHDILNTLNLFD